MDRHSPSDTKSVFSDTKRSKPEVVLAEEESTEEESTTHSTAPPRVSTSSSHHSSSSSWDDEDDYEYDGSLPPTDRANSFSFALADDEVVWRDIPSSATFMPPAANTSSLYKAEYSTHEFFDGANYGNYNNNGNYGNYSNNANNGNNANNANTTYRNNRVADNTYGRSSEEYVSPYVASTFSPFSTEPITTSSTPSTLTVKPLPFYQSLDPRSSFTLPYSKFANDLGASGINAKKLISHFKKLFSIAELDIVKFNSRKVSWTLEGYSDFRKITLKCSVYGKGKDLAAEVDLKEGDRYHFRNITARLLAVANNKPAPRETSFRNKRLVEIPKGTKTGISNQKDKQTDRKTDKQTDKQTSDRKTSRKDMTHHNAGSSSVSTSSSSPSTASPAPQPPSELCHCVALIESEDDDLKSHGAISFANAIEDGCNIRSLAKVERLVNLLDNRHPDVARCIATVVAVLFERDDQAGTTKQLVENGVVEKLIQKAGKQKTSSETRRQCCRALVALLPQHKAKIEAFIKQGHEATKNLIQMLTGEKAKEDDRLQKFAQKLAPLVKTN